MAVKSDAYQKQGGMSKRKAGEDFYFLQKIIKLGDFTNLNTTTVYPSSRMSHRVPFGTGRAITEFMKQPESRYLTYHPNTFEDLKHFTDLLPKLSQASTSSANTIWECLSAAFQGYIPKKKFTDTIQELNHKTGNQSSFEKRFFHWVDGFFAFKFANYSVDYYPKVDVTEAAAWMLKKGYDLKSASDHAADILMQFRVLDKKATG
jgi:hypothetical protein